MAMFIWENHEISISCLGFPRTSHRFQSQVILRDASCGVIREVSRALGWWHDQKHCEQQTFWGFLQWGYKTKIKWIIYVMEHAKKTEWFGGTSHFRNPHLEIRFFFVGIFDGWYSKEPGNSPATGQSLPGVGLYPWNISILLIFDDQFWWTTH